MARRQDRVTPILLGTSAAPGGWVAGSAGTHRPIRHKIRGSLLTSEQRQRPFVRAAVAKPVKRLPEHAVAPVSREREQAHGGVSGGEKVSL
jgi:hypothetical protein